MSATGDDKASATSVRHLPAADPSASTERAPAPPADGSTGGTGGAAALATGPLTPAQVLERAAAATQFRLFWEGWEAARGSEPAPTFEDILDSKAVALAHEFTLLDWVGEGQLLYRLAGTGVIARADREVTGTNFFDLLDPALVPTGCRNARSMTSLPCGNYSRHDNLHASGRSVVVEAMSLPVRSGRAANGFELLSVGITLGETDPKRRDTDDLLESRMTVLAFVDAGSGVPDFHPSDPA